MGFCDYLHVGVIDHHWWMLGIINLCTEFEVHVLVSHSTIWNGQKIGEKTVTKSSSCPLRGLFFVSLIAY